MLSILIALAFVGLPLRDSPFWWPTLTVGLAALIGFDTFAPWPALAAVLFAACYAAFRAFRWGQTIAKKRGTLTAIGEFACALLSLAALVAAAVELITPALAPSLTSNPVYHTVLTLNKYRWEAFALAGAFVLLLAAVDTWDDPKPIPMPWLADFVDFHKRWLGKHFFNRIRNLWEDFWAFVKDLWRRALPVIACACSAIVIFALAHFSQKHLASGGLTTALAIVVLFVLCSLTTAWSAHALSRQSDEDRADLLRETWKGARPYLAVVNGIFIVSSLVFAFFKISSLGWLTLFSAVILAVTLMVGTFLWLRALGGARPPPSGTPA